MEAGVSFSHVHGSTDEVKIKTHRDDGEAAEGAGGVGEVGEEEPEGPHGSAEGVVVLEMDGSKHRHEAAVQEREQEEGG